MTNIYELHKYVKGSDKNSREENLLTGILCWALEHNKELLADIINRAIGFAETNEGRTNLSRNLEGIELEGEDVLYTFQKSLSTSIREGIADFEISGNKFVILGENKVVPEDMTSEQIQRYYKAALQIYPEKKVFILCITPDKHEHILGVFSQIDEKDRELFYWTSWDTLWEICNELLENNEDDIVLHEVKEAIRMAGLKPFTGFTDKFMGAMENIQELKAIPEFFASCDRIITDSTKLGLKSEGKTRYDMEEGKIYPWRIYRLYFGNDWKNINESNRNCYCIEFIYGKTPKILVSLWFEKGEVNDNFMKNSDLHQDLLYNIKKEFPDYDVILDYEGGRYFGIKIPLESSEKSKTLIGEIERIVRFLNNDTVKKLENADYSF